ncbi:AEC family transporter [Robertmurraya sp. P23]|uniref:AEC family transporter n=1 Tax=Robertmurraya sp. P23 TaxID=3436931 RepID=UPI003D9550DA
MNVIVGAILPVFIVFLLGYILQKAKGLDIRALSTVTVYVLIPCLVFRSLLETKIEQQYLMMVFIVVLLMVITIIIAKIVARFRRIDTDTESAYILSTVFMNAGNYGTPIVLFVFGNEAFNIAISFYVIQLILFNTVGIYYASRSKEGLDKGLKNIFKLPAIYAVFLAFLFRQLPILPDNIFQIINLLADGAIPIIMLLLGMQLANLKVEVLNWGQISFVTTMRLIISPLIAFVITWLLPVDPIYRNVIITLAAMPTAVNVTLYSLEFNIQPKFVSVTTIVNTFISVITVSILLNILG